MGWHEMGGVHPLAVPLPSPSSLAHNIFIKPLPYNGWLGWVCRLRATLFGMAAHSGSGLSGNVQTLTGTAAQIVGPAAYPRRVWIHNLDTAAVYIGGSSGLTTANGFPLPAAAATESTVFGPIDLAPHAEMWGIGDASAAIRFLVQDGIVV